MKTPIPAMRFFSKTGAVAFLALSCLAAHATDTGSQLIGSIHVESGGSYYAKTSENSGVWATSNSQCGTPIEWLWIKSTTVGSKEMLSLLLTAKSTGLKVKAAGACGTGGNATYLDVSQIALDL